MFKQYTELVNKEETGYIRSLMDFNYPENGVPLDEVESVDSIVTSFQDRRNVLRFHFTGSA